MRKNASHRRERAGNTEICQKELGFSVVTTAFFFCLDLLIRLKSSMQPKIFWKTFHQSPYDTHFTAELIVGQARNMSGVFYSDSYDPYPGSGYWRQFEEMTSARQSSSIASGASNNTNASRAKSARPIMGRKSRVAVERRAKNMKFGEKSAKS